MKIISKRYFTSVVKYEIIYNPYKFLSIKVKIIRCDTFINWIMTVKIAIPFYHVLNSRFYALFILKTWSEIVFTKCLYSKSSRMILKWTMFENTKYCDYSCLSLKRANKAQWICHLSIHGTQGDRLHCWRRPLCQDQAHAQVSCGRRV